jgi:hypothetical protein
MVAHGVGRNEPCPCGSGKEFKNCCGAAFSAFEISDSYSPYPIPDIKLSPDLRLIEERAKSSNVEQISLDFVLRDTPDTSKRVAWTKVSFEDSGYRNYHLPDMANIHLGCARCLLEDSVRDPDTIQYSLSALMLSANALEAFINQIALFASECSAKGELKFATLANASTATTRCANQDLAAP